MNYEKLTKSQLIEVIMQQQASMELGHSKITEYDKLKLNYDIVVNARKEDNDKVKKAEEIIQTFQNRENELVQHFKNQQALMKKDLDGQNEAMVNLFDMMDATINTQILFYNKFKNTFISVTPKEE